jgi:steroid 5-alpha reductase family enzyme
VDSVNQYFLLAGALLIYQSVWFVVAIIRKRNDVADIAWGLGFILLAWLSYSGATNQRALLVNLLVTLWGLRLSWHIYKRNRGQQEDFRYANWRKQWKHVYLRSFLQVFMLQGLMLFIIAWPVLFINQAGFIEWQSWDMAGVIVWLTGFLFESVGDFQLAQFKKNPANRGKLITTGLWQFTRHPNYFGEAVQWWGIFLIACSLPMGWITVVSPVVITYLLRYVSGVPMLERKYAQHPDFKTYQQNTSVFFPWKLISNHHHFFSRRDET